MSIEPRNEQQMLRQFWKKYPTYNLNAMMRKRYEELMDAKAFNEWLQNRQLKQQGEVRRRHGQNGGQPQSPPAAVGGGRAAAGPPSRPAGCRAVLSKAWKSGGPSVSEFALTLPRCWTTSRKVSP